MSKLGAISPTMRHHRGPGAPLRDAEESRFRLHPERRSQTGRRGDYSLRRARGGAGGCRNVRGDAQLQGMGLGRQRSADHRWAFRRRQPGRLDWACQPEAAAHGRLPPCSPATLIDIDLDNRRIDLVVDPAEVQRRLERAAPFAPDISSRWLAGMRGLGQQRQHRGPYFWISRYPVTHGGNTADGIAESRLDLDEWRMGVLGTARRCMSPPHALHYGSSVFEGIRAYATPAGPALLGLGLHVQRLFNSCKIRAYRGALFARTDQRGNRPGSGPQQHESCYVRPLVFRGSNVIGLDGRACPTEVVIFTWNGAVTRRRKPSNRALT